MMPASLTCSPLRRPLSGWRSWLALAGLALAVAAPLPVGAQAVLLLPDVCDDPSEVFDYQWAAQKRHATSVFVMLADRSVNFVSGSSQDFNSFSDLYVAAHGGASTIGTITYDDFATGLKAAHNSTPNLVFFAVCSSAVGPNSLLNRVNGKYGDNVNRLEGGTSGCALTGNGQADLTQADYRVAAKKSNLPRYETIRDNIMAKWKGNHPSSPRRNYRQQCLNLLAPFSANGMSAFLRDVYHDFSQPDSSDDSTNYLELVAINKKGDPMAVCGANPSGGGREPCP